MVLWVPVWTGVNSKYGTILSLNYAIFVRELWSFPMTNRFGRASTFILRPSRRYALLQLPCVPHSAASSRSLPTIANIGIWHLDRGTANMWVVKLSEYIHTCIHTYIFIYFHMEIILRKDKCFSPYKTFRQKVRFRNRFYYLWITITGNIYNKIANNFS